MWSRFPQQNLENEESSLRRKCFGCSDFYLIMDVMGITFFVHLTTLITSIYCITLQDGAGNTIMSYDPGELLSKIFNLNDTIQTRSRNGFRFDDQNTYTNEAAIERPIYLSPADDVSQNNVNNNHKLTYADNNQIIGNQKKRRRKQKYQRPPGFGPQSLVSHGLNMVQPGIRNPYIDFQGPVYRPTEPPRASFASETLSMVTEALTSMALYDDLQCVPRLLCEAASGGALGSSQTLQSISGLQPLLTLLSAYGGVSSNPLFVFGRAAILGISSKKNPASCRYAYPNCPTDPEKLVFYLNNHNGGFFRFFNAPQRGPQNIGQFYDELTQNFANFQPIPPFQQNGVSNLYQNQQQIPNQDYNEQNYGFNYPYKQDKYGLLHNVRFKNNDESNEAYRIEKRIQNRPAKYLNNDEDLNFDDEYYQSSKWSFPETDNSITSDSYRVGKGLRFPGNFNEENVDTFKRDPRGFVFPEATTKYLSFNKYHHINPSSQQIIYDDLYNNEDIYEVRNQDDYTKDQSIRTVYVVRGNGDPRRPEIVKLGPGQSVH